MKSIIQVFLKKFNQRVVSFGLIILILSFMVQACQEEIAVQEDIVLKAAPISELNLIHPDEVAVGEDFTISYSSNCGKVIIERGYLNGDPIIENEIIIGYQKVYTGMTCDLNGLLWEPIGSKEFKSCNGESIIENLDEVGTYVYRVKLSQKEIKGSGCPSCKTFKGTRFQCFMITVVEGNSGIVTDIEGNIYNWVKIGEQIWMAENLKTTKYKDGSSITNIADGSEWGTAITGAYYWQNNDPLNKPLYGALYNWYAASSESICPEGWHVPTDMEWKQLEIFLGLTSIEADATSDRGTDLGFKMKSTNGWVFDGNGSNSSGFNAVAAGYCIGPGIFGATGYAAYFWSSTETNTSNAWGRYLHCSSPGISRFPFVKQNGYSVRCVRN